MTLLDADELSLHVMTQNLRNSTGDTSPGESDHWPDRAPVLTELLRTDPDVVGTQEVLFEQIVVLDSALGATHFRLGSGRDGGARGEHNLLYLRKDRFELLDWDQFWLSEDPRRVGSVGWGAGCTRICVWARVLDQAVGREAVFAVTHLDHASEEARQRGSEVIVRELLGGGAAKEADGTRPVDWPVGAAPGGPSTALPLILMGDFNAAGGASTAWDTLTGAGLQDAHDITAELVGEDFGTFPNYQEPQVGTVRIDWILERGLAVDEYRAHYPAIGPHHASDHLTLEARLHYV
jgi:endonuclease/exonuclease/phosphatase family metal-dependent hydrolase